ncbi:TlyA family RNA methyltransferase [bacterium]|nr:TlyA family RNA methyltransferase [bacterium]
MKNRLDKELLNRNLALSRSKAQDLIKSNLVYVNDKLINRAGFFVLDTDDIKIKENDIQKYVSRGGLKLEKAINEFNIDFTDLNVLDIGSSTGGFCDCALQHGANSILAIDVGTNLLHESLRKDSRITLYEQTDFREIGSDKFHNIDIITCDVSFISLKPIIKKIHDEKIKIDGIFLIKPQFECGKEVATRYKGIILNKKEHSRILDDLFQYFNKNDFYIKNITYSPIKGGDGNIEYLVYLSNKIDKNIEINIEELVNKAFN